VILLAKFREDPSLHHAKGENSIFILDLLLEAKDF
jgi:hypothetical protein